jgi:hypothetical protein
VLQCEECKAISETGEGWVAFLVSDEEERAVELHAAEFCAAQRQVVVYCPECAKREFGEPA